MEDILSLTIEELSERLMAAGEAAYRAKQVFGWLHNKKAASFDEMTDLSKELRVKLGENFVINSPKIIKIEKSLEDNTEKYLLELTNNTIIESVLMGYKYGNTACISSQEGCRMGCSFCATAINGLVRDLFPGEMLSQIYEMEKQSGKKISRCVIMGQGEPFDNFENTVKFISLLNSKHGHNMGMRSITVSTCGLVPEILKFAGLNLQVNLAVSLHAPDDTVRNKIMKISRKYSYDNLLQACRLYTEKTNRQITFEYALIDGINDSDNQAKTLAGKIKGMLCHVNLIPVNKVEELVYKKSKRTGAFAGILQKAGISVTVRRELGSDINGACGQLKLNSVNNKSGHYK